MALDTAGACRKSVIAGSNEEQIFAGIVVNRNY